MRSNTTDHLESEFKRAPLDLVDSSDSVTVFIKEQTAWLSQRSLSTLFELTAAAISDHITNIKIERGGVESKQIRLMMREGGRLIERWIEHFSVSILHAIAMRSRRFDALENILSQLQLHGIDTGTRYIVTRRQERECCTLLARLLDGIAVVKEQFSVGPFLVDFYLPVENIAIEYDELHHSNTQNRIDDAARQAFITTQLRCRFVRIEIGHEIDGLNAILRLVIDKKQSSIG